MMSSNPLNVLFLCTGNSARSIMAEAILQKLGHPRFAAFSAGSHPTGNVHPLTIELLNIRQHPTHVLRSKSWLEFSRENAPSLDLVITVCDRAAAGSCPLWSGPVTKAHWSIEDPAAALGNHDDRLRAFADVYRTLERHIQQLIKLPSWPVDAETLNVHLQPIV
ncbi:MAG: arsenate reductase ArsC [Nitrospirales bacterium]|nr:arsenate reductase ArsC [Nitrospira sp.]MDR4502009.1 arsenate reductase ArsC [Nitrospirales bacterium]